MEKSTFLAVILSVFVLFIWSGFFSKAPKQQVNEINIQNNSKEYVDETPTYSRTAVSVPFNKKQKIEENHKNNIEVYELENSSFKIKISSLGAKIIQVSFLKHSTDFFSTSNSVLDAPFIGYYPLTELLFSVEEITENKITLVSDDGDRVEYEILDKNTIGIKIETEKALSSMFVYKNEGKDKGFSLAENPLNRERFFAYSYDKNVEIIKTSKVKEQNISVSPDWVSISDRYFAISLIPEKASIISVGTENESNFYIFTGRLEKNTFVKHKLFVGEKDLNTLKMPGVGLDKMINYGMLTVLALPMLEFMKFVYKFVPNYGWAIIILTLFIKLLLFPLQHKSMKSMKKLQELQPHMAKIREKYKDDKEKMNKELMQFMSTHNVNMAKGCLPLILQMPVFFALYRVLGNAVELYGEPWLLWVTDLSSKDPLYILPILMGVAMFIQQKMSPSNLDPAQAKMMLIMPVVMVFIMASLPSGLTLYILFSTVFGLAQQILVNRQKA